jgi:phosphoribosylformylglycinamidine synthase
MKPGQVMEVPIAHAEGNFTMDEAGLEDLESRGGAVFRYCGPDGTVDEAHVPNGSVHGIAGIISQRGNVLGMMPHPERAIEPERGGTEGLGIFQSLASHFAAC